MKRKPISVRNHNATEAREREFENYYLQSYTLVYNYVRCRMSNDVEAEDIVAEAYLKAARAFDRYDPTRSKFSTWVIAIAVNCMKRHYRKVRPTAPLEDIPESAIAVSGEQKAVDDKDLVLRLLQVLDPEELELVFMKYHEGMRNVEMAEKLNMNASTVSTKLSNARAKMKNAAEKV